MSWAEEYSSPVIDPCYRLVYNIYDGKKKNKFFHNQYVIRGKVSCPFRKDIVDWVKKECEALRKIQLNTLLFIIKRFTCCILCNGAARSMRFPAGISCTSPLVITFPSLAAANSKTFAPLTTNPAITPKNGRSTLPLLRFHRPPTWIVDWLLNTVNWWPIEIQKSEFIFMNFLISPIINYYKLFILSSPIIILNSSKYRNSLTYIDISAF